MRLLSHHECMADGYFQMPVATQHQRHLAEDEHQQGRRAAMFDATVSFASGGRFESLSYFERARLASHSHLT
jgi:hypothetical protein